MIQNSAFQIYLEFDSDNEFSIQIALLIQNVTSYFIKTR